MSEEWMRLRDYVIARRVSLGFRTRGSWSAYIEKLTGVRISTRTIGTLERGGRVSADTMAAIEAALEWAPGSWRRVLAGGSPELEERVEQPDPLRDQLRGAFEERQRLYGFDRAIAWLEQQVDEIKAERATRTNLTDHGQRAG